MRQAWYENRLTSNYDVFLARTANHEVVNLGKLQDFIDMGRLVPKEDKMVTMRDLYESGIISNVRDGVKLLAKVRSIVRPEVLWHDTVDASKKKKMMMMMMMMTQSTNQPTHWLTDSTLGYCVNRTKMHFEHQSIWK